MKRIAILFCCLLLLGCTTTEAATKDPQWEQWLDKRRRAIAEASACEVRPQNEGELFAVAMRNYWRREMRAVWRQDANLNRHYPGAAGRINVTDKDCGLIRDGAGNPLRIARDTCYPWKLAEYNTLDKVAERLKLVPQFGEERGFDRPGSREGGWIYDEIVQNLLRGEAYPPDGKPLYLPEHAAGNAGFAVLHKRGNAVRWYGPDCCALMRYEEAKEERAKLVNKPGHATSIDVIGTDYLPPGISLEDLRVLRVSYHDVDFNLDSGQGGVYALGRGKLDDYNMNITKYYLISPCGEIICWGWPGKCERI